ncbi:tlr0894 [Thermosynechococcus vestitus BP-1]|uniref:Tlr0894 protein n=2 Tax=Thermosynechococcus vestitus TaxID=146786 RepID=Q8DKG5_THEVB|nr:tlr0894 [Thermosynechococcus vestitus BP-1]
MGFRWMSTTGFLSGLLLVLGCQAATVLPGTLKTPGKVPPFAPRSLYTTIDEFGQPQFQVDGRKLFRDRPLPPHRISTVPIKLLQVLRSTRQYFQDFSETDPITQREGILGIQGVTLPQVLDTLDFMIATLTEDISRKRPIRLQDPAFINQHFRVIQWLPHNPRNPNQTEELRLTNYAVFTHRGSHTPTQTYNTALYALPPRVSNQPEDRFYQQLTKQQVLAGIFEPGGALHGRVQPLAYLTRAAFEDALMQGTILVEFTDGSRAFFNVDRNNGLPFVKGVSPYEQQRYWYFRQVAAIKGYGSTIENKINIEPEVTFAGDVWNIGLGRVVVIEDRRGKPPQLRLGVIADTGGAFAPNLYQLDFLAGIFRDRPTYQAVARQLPNYVRAYILIKKPVKSRNQ